MPQADLLLRGQRIFLEGSFRPAAIAVRDGKIAAVEEHDSARPAMSDEDFGELTVLPGLLDTHVHINDPGRDWEGFASATRAAAAGGVTTLIDMPLNSSPVTTTVAALERKLEAMRGRCRVDVGLWGGLVPGNLAHLEPLLDAGVLGFKAFMVDSGIDDFQAVHRRHLERAMPRLADCGAVLLVHAEAPGPIARAAGAVSDPRRYADYLASRPPAAEVEAIEGLIELSARTGCAVHVVHLATSAALETLAAARRGGVPITVETCPHYLTFAAEDIPDGATEYKCAPPIRDASTREALWRALADGLIDLVASDHSPCPPAMKKLEEGDFMAAWGGVASLQLTLPAVWTGARRRGFDAAWLGRWLSERPARLAGLERRKGKIAAGFDADLTVCDLAASFTVRPSSLYHRYPLTPYGDRELYGVVEQTWLRGERIYHRGRLADEPRGMWLRT